MTLSESILKSIRQDEETVKHIQEHTRAIRLWLVDMGIINDMDDSRVVINDDLTIDFDSSIYLDHSPINKLPDYIRFNYVSGDFYVTKCKNLETLKGCPKKIGGTFCCDVCPNLKSLEGAPLDIGVNFFCRRCKKIRSLKGCPTYIPCSFSCVKCPNLKTLDGCPKSVSYQFEVINCGENFTADDVRKKCRVGSKIIVN